MLNFEHEATFFGPNPLASAPVIVARIGSSDDDGLLSDDAWTQGCRLLRESFPEWVDAPRTSVQHPLVLVGRTAARWALAALNETHGFLHDAGASAVGPGARLWLGFHHPDVSIFALKTALAVLAHAARLRQIDRSRADAALESIWQLCRSHHPDTLGRVVMQGARALDIPILPFVTGSMFWQYGWGCRSRVLVETSSNADGHLAGMLANSKVFSKKVFAELGIPTPDHRVVTRVNDLPEAIKAVGWPCVVKPVFQRAGKGVTVGVRTMSEAEAAFAVARPYDAAVMVEAFVPGDDYRLMVIEGRFFKAVRREPPSVTGDGRSTIAELIAALNSGRSTNKVKSRYLAPIITDDGVEQHLKQRDVNIDTVLETGWRITLRGNANRSTGGICFDVTGEVHPHIKQMVETAARTIGLAAAGFDFVTTDIGKPWHECGALIEVNVSPGLFVLIAAGLEPVSVASAILGTAPARIPVRLVVTPRSELPHLLEHLRSMPPAAGFGWACDEQAAIAGMPLRVAAGGPRRAVEALLHHRSLQGACIVCSIEALVHHGMPVDKVDSTTLYRCDSTPLPPAWMKVLADHGGTISTGSDWTDLRPADFATTSLSSAVAAPSPRQWIEV